MPLSLKDSVYTYAVGSDIQRDGMYLEVSDKLEGKGILLEIFYSDRTQEMTISVFSRICRVTSRSDSLSVRLAAEYVSAADSSAITTRKTTANLKRMLITTIRPDATTYFAQESLSS